MEHYNVMSDSLYNTIQYHISSLTQVCFVSEQGVDTDGLTREFRRLFLNEIVKMYCIGDAGNCLSRMFLHCT